MSNHEVWKAIEQSGGMNFENLMPNEKVRIDTEDASYTIETQNADFYLVDNSSQKKKPQKIKIFGIPQKKDKEPQSMESNFIREGYNMEILFEESGEEKTIGPITKFQIITN